MKGLDDLLIVGAGPAGMTAGVYAARKGLNPLVVSMDIGGQANWSSGIENYPGFIDIPGSELMRRFAEHMTAQRLRYEENEIERIEPTSSGFEARGTNGRTYAARAAIVATGKRPKMLDVPGEAEFRGKGVSYCSACDAPLFHQARVAIVGGGNAGLQACHDLLPIATEIHLIAAETVTADRAVSEKVLGNPKLNLHENHAVKAIRGGKLVERIEIVGPDGRTTELPVEGVFIEIGLAPNSHLVSAHVACNREREIDIDCSGRTGLPGLFAAGDVTIALGKQVIIAAGEGAKAALAAADYLAFGR